MNFCTNRTTPTVAITSASPIGKRAIGRIPPCGQWIMTTNGAFSANMKRITPQNHQHLLRSQHIPTANVFIPRQMPALSPISNVPMAQMKKTTGSVQAIIMRPRYFHAPCFSGICSSVSRSSNRATVISPPYTVRKISPHHYRRGCPSGPKLRKVCCQIPGSS